MPGSALELAVENGSITGIVIELDGRPVFLPTNRVVLATGGVGGLWRSTTNPRSSRGSGLALAAKAGAVLADLEFIQFHPTALAVGADPMPLISEAVRGEGAVLVDRTGSRFMADTLGADLAPRDVVARAVFRRWAEGDSAGLDVREWPTGQFAARFPNIFHVLSEFGLDPARDPIPVRPAAHYHMGGVEVGPTGRTSIGGLWACGEVACTKLHGANRLASNSLLEAVVCGREAGEDIGGTPGGRVRTGDALDFTPPRPSSPETLGKMREIMEAGVGVTRNAAGLIHAIRALGTIFLETKGTDAANAAAISLLIARAALRRTESRGAHWRDDSGPQTQPPAHSRSNWAELAERFNA